MDCRDFDSRDSSLPERYLPFLRDRLTPARLQHSLGVMRVMAELAPIYSLDLARAMTAGLLHDVARDLSSEALLALAEEAQMDLRHPCERHPVYLHAPVGAYLAARDLGVTDQLVLEAIAAHSHAGNGFAFDAPPSRALRFADLLAPSQRWKGMKKLRDLVYGGRADEAALLQCAWLLEYFEERGLPVHPNLVRQYEMLSARLVTPPTFFERE